MDATNRRYQIIHAIQISCSFISTIVTQFNNVKLWATDKRKKSTFAGGVFFFHFFLFSFSFLLTCLSNSQKSRAKSGTLWWHWKKATSSLLLESTQKINDWFASLSSMFVTYRRLSSIFSGYFQPEIDSPLPFFRSFFFFAIQQILVCQNARSDARMGSQTH